VTRFSGPVLAAAILLAAAWPAEAQTFRYMAFGDSITKGRNDFDEQHLGGYPGRLPGKIGCVMPNCAVVNKGKDGEKTVDGVTRIETILDNQGPWDVVLLMEGTNDIHLSISNNTIQANLTLMDTKARVRGVDTLHGSIIHLDPQSQSGGNQAKVAAVENMRTRVMNLAAARNRYFADPWTPLCPTQQCFNQHYHNPGQGDPNTVGHPDASGFNIMANWFASSITQNPVPGPVTVVAPTGTIDDASPNYVWNQEAGGWANWYQLRLLAGATVIADTWHEEWSICSAGLCTVNLGAFPDGDYTWEVRGRNPRGRSSWVSTPFTILTVLPPTEPGVVAPTLPSADPEPDFVWNREQPVAASVYRLEVSDEGGVIHDEEVPVLGNCPDGTCSFDPFAGTPLAEGDYSWRVRGENTGGAGPWTAPTPFAVDFAVVFSDGFESGDTTVWSTTVP
jgi:lysophospholipase L1-like esterase